MVSGPRRLSTPGRVARSPTAQKPWGAILGQMTSTIQVAQLRMVSVAVGHCPILCNLFVFSCGEHICKRALHG